MCGNSQRKRELERAKPSHHVIIGRARRGPSAALMARLRAVAEISVKPQINFPSDEAPVTLQNDRRREHLLPTLQAGTRGSKANPGQACFRPSCDLRG